MLTAKSSLRQGQLATGPGDSALSDPVFPREPDRGPALDGRRGVVLGGHGGGVGAYRNSRRKRAVGAIDGAADPLLAVKLEHPGLGQELRPVGTRSPGRRPGTDAFQALFSPT